MMKPSDFFVMFALDGHRLALHLSAVVRVIAAVEVTPLPGGSERVIGVINMGGKVVPVFNVRRRVHLPDREIGPGDQFVLARAARREVVLPVDCVFGVIECAAEGAGEIMPGIGYAEGVAKRDDGLILIQDLEKFLSVHEEETPGQAVGA